MRKMGGWVALWRPFLSRLFSRTLPRLSQSLYRPESAASVAERKVIDAVHSLKKVGFLKETPRVAPLLWKDSLIFRARIGKAEGISFRSSANSLWAALGEFVERTLWTESDEWYRERVSVASFAEAGNDALDPLSFVGVAQERRRRNRALSISPNTSLAWIEAHSLTGAYKKVPLQLFSAQYLGSQSSSLHPEPLVRDPVTTGLAAGQSLSEALLRGALEIIERDAFMITYLNRLTPTRLDLRGFEDEESFHRLFSHLGKKGVEAHLVLLPSDFSIPVVAALLVGGAEGPAFAMGASADFNLREAAAKALGEALSVHQSLKQRESLGLELPKQAGNMGKDERLLYWAREENLAALEFLWSAPLKKIPIPSFSQERSGGEALYEKLCEERLELIQKNLSANQCDIYWVEMTSNAVREASPFRVVSMVSPQLQPMHLREEFANTAGERLRTVPLKLGYTPATALNPLPHPFP